MRIGVYKKENGLPAIFIKEVEGYVIDNNLYIKAPCMRDVDFDIDDICFVDMKEVTEGIGTIKLTML